MQPIILAALVFSTAALAAPRAAYVLRIEGADVFVDVGRADGAAAGTRLKVYRVIEARHPVTGKALQGRFFLGELPVAEVGEALSRVRASPELLGLLSVGDVVELPEAPRAAATTPRAASVPAAPGGERRAPDGKGGRAPVATAPELADLKSAWEQALSLPPRERAQVWEQFLAAYPDSSLSGPLQAEIALLRSAADATDSRKARPAGALVPAPSIAVSSPSRTLRGEPLAVVAATTEGPVPRAVLLQWRTRGAATFKTVHMVPEGEGYFRAQVPPEGAVEPGVDYFVEVVDGAGEVRPAAGTPQEPLGVDVRIPPGAEPVEKRDRSRVRLHDEFVDFNRFAMNDTYNLLEGDFLYRIYGVVHAVRVGFGIYQGVGTSKDMLDAGPGPWVRPVGYTYGFGELELRLASSLAVLLKGSTGITPVGLRGGFEARLRIGSEAGTSLVLGGASTANIGQRANIALNWDAVRGWPMGAEVIVTNEPIGEDLGVRLIYSVGRSVTPWLDLQARLGYQLRDINHSGVSFGLGSTFHW